MEFLSKIASLLFSLFLLFLWNKFVVPFLVKLITGFHKRNNKQNLNRQPIKFVIENELKIIRFIQVFYWRNTNADFRNYQYKNYSLK